MKHSGTQFLLGAICPNTLISTDYNVTVAGLNLPGSEDNSDNSFDHSNYQVKQFIEYCEDQILENWQNKTYMILVFDIDKFSSINQKYGHSAGDELLHTIMIKLDAEVHKPNHYCRLFNDNFAVFLENCSEIDIALEIIKFAEEINNKFPLLQPKLSFGISRTKGKYVNAPYLCNRAFLAKSTIKGKSHLLANYDEVLTSGQ